MPTYVQSTVPMATCCLKSYLCECMQLTESSTQCPHFTLHQKIIKGTRFTFLPCPALAQNAMIAALCTLPAPVLHDPELVVVGGGWSCMLLLHSASTCADASPDLCTLHPDLCTLCLQWLPPAATYGGGVSLLTVSAKNPLAPLTVSPIATCAGGVFP